MKHTTFLPSYIKPWRQYNLLFRGCRTTVRCQNGSDNNYRTKPTSVWALVTNGMNFVLLFITEVIPPSRWVSNSSCKRRLGRNRQSIPSTTQQRYYNVTNLPADTFFKGQRTRLGNTAFHLPPTYRSAIQSSCLQPNRGTNYFCSSVFLRFHSKPNPLSMCHQPTYLFRPLGTFSFMTISIQCMIYSVYM